MNARSICAFSIFAGICSLAAAADPHHAAAKALIFSESIERGMMRDAAMAKKDFLLQEPPTTSEWKLEGAYSGSLGWANTGTNSRSSCWAVAPVQAVATGINMPAAADANSEESKSKASKELQEAARLLREHKLDESLNELWEAMRNCPQLVSDHAAMDRLLAQASESSEGRAKLDPEPLIFSGWIALEDNRIADAESDFYKARQLVAAIFDADRKRVAERFILYGQAAAAERREQWAKAQAPLEEYLKQYPYDIVALQLLARALFWQGHVGKHRGDDVVGAYDILKIAKEIDKSNAMKNHTEEQLLPPAATMAQWYDAFGRISHAHYRKNENTKIWLHYALMSAPNDLKLRTVVAQWALANGEMALAKEQADAALGIGTVHNALCRTLCGTVALWQKRWPEAEKYFEEVVLEEPNNFAAKNSLALALVEQDDAAKKQRALAYAEANLAQCPNSAEALSTLAWIHYRRGEFELAAHALDKADAAIDRDANPFDVYLSADKLANFDLETYRAYILFHGGKKRQAMQLLQKLLEIGQPFSRKPEAQELFRQAENPEKE